MRALFSGSHMKPGQSLLYSTTILYDIYIYIYIYLASGYN